MDIVSQARQASTRIAERTASVLTMRDVSKAYGATMAVRRVSLEIEPGEVHAILGENGAGKSTIVKILSGIVSPDGGTLTIDGADYAPRNSMDARAARVSTAFQELSLLPNLTVAENLMLPKQAKGALGIVSRRQNRERAAQTLGEFGLSHIHPDLPIGSLSLAEKQRVEIARAASRHPKLLVLDEPTASLAEPEWLFEIIARLTSAGAGVLYISHRLSEVRRLCRRGTVLRNGESIETVSLADVPDARIFELMVGTAARETSRASAPAFDATQPAAVSAKNVGGGATVDVSFEMRRGEILGVAALEGQGQRDLFRMLAGLRDIERGEIAIDGAPASLGSPAAALRAGVAFVPEERKTEGVFLGLKTEANVSLSLLKRLSRFGVLSRSQERRRVQTQARRVDLAERYLERKIGELSGGNQQKALIARVLASGARILALYDPTRGVDVGTKAVIYDAIRDFTRQGGSALIYSTELSELIHLVDRCLVVYRGKIAGEASGEALTEPRLVALATGHGA